MRTKPRAINGWAALLGLLALGLAAQASHAGDENAELGDRFGAVIAHGDFNADGYGDVAISAPDERLGLLTMAGAVDVIYGGTGGLDIARHQFWNPNLPDVEGGAESYGQFGLALATGDFNADGYDDLAIGAPGDTVDGMVKAGAVHVLYGSTWGLSATEVLDQIWTQDTLDVEDVAEVYDQMGFALAAGDFNHDGYDDLAMGVRYEDLSVLDAGMVNVLYGSASGLSARVVPDQRWHQDVGNVEDDAEAYDYFGGALAAADFNADGYDDLAIGVPGEDVSGVTNAGAVNVLYGSPSGLDATFVPDQIWHQDVVDVEDAAEAYDQFGSSLTAGDFNADGYADLAIGVPSEDLSSKVDAGAVNVLYGSIAGLSPTTVRDQRWDQDVNKVEDVVEARDAFGLKLAAADFNADGYDDLAVGAWGESVDGLARAGSVNVIYGAISGLSATVVPDQRWNQAVVDVDDLSEANDRFGGSLGAGDFNADGYEDLVMGVPNESYRCGQTDLYAVGAVNVLYGSIPGLSATAIPDQFSMQPCP